jgi:hypothetical protein
MAEMIGGNVVTRFKVTFHQLRHDSRDYRTTGASEWTALPWSPKSTASSQPVDQSLAWIEMPPGGWIDGQYQDPGWPGGDHAYVVELKSERNAKVVRMVSPPYHFTAN